MTDPFGTGTGKYPAPKVVNDFHHNSDLDKSAEAQHHSLGNGINQAINGKHNHRDGNGQPLLDDFVISGSRSTNTVAVLTQMLACLSALGATDATTA